MIVTAVIEIPEGSQNKYEYNGDTGHLRMDRVLHGSMHYPCNYGFLPQTWGEDDDPLDILVFSSSPIYPGVQVGARVIGALLMQDEHGPDAKIISVADVDPRYNHISAVDDLGTYRLREVRHFFSQYKVLQNLPVTVGNYQDVTIAETLVHDARLRFRAIKLGNGAAHD